MADIFPQFFMQRVERDEKIYQAWLIKQRPHEEQQRIRREMAIAKNLHLYQLPYFSQDGNLKYER